MRVDPKQCFVKKSRGSRGRSWSFLGALRLTFVNGNLRVPRPMPRFPLRKKALDRPFFLSHLSLQESHAGSARIPAGNGALQNPRMHGQRIGPTRPPGGRKTSTRIWTYHLGVGTKKKYTLISQHHLRGAKMTLRGG